MRYVEPFKNKNSLNEIYQTSGVRFALAAAPEGDLIQVTPWVKCRDYFSEAACIEGPHKVGYKACDIFGFKYPVWGLPRWTSSNNGVLLIKGMPGWESPRVPGLSILENWLGESLYAEPVQAGKKVAHSLRLPERVMSHPTVLHTFTFLVRILSYRNSAGSKKRTLDSIIEDIPAGHLSGSDDTTINAHFSEIEDKEGFVKYVLREGHKTIEVKPGADEPSTHRGAGFRSLLQAYLKTPHTLPCIVLKSFDYEQA